MSIESTIRQIVREELELAINKLSNSKELPELMELQDVIDYTKIARATLYEMVKKGTFPSSVHIGERRRAWKKEDIKKWINSK